MPLARGPRSVEPGSDPEGGDAWGRDVGGDPAMIHNLAKRAHDRNWTLDPVVRSLLDTDWYKLAMLQFIWRHFAGTRVRFTLINRTRAVRLAQAVDEAELRRQLDHARGLRFTKSELIWLAGNTFYGQRNIFGAAFLEWLAGFSLPPYRLSREDGQLRLDFEGPWERVTLWRSPRSPSSPSCAPAAATPASAGWTSTSCSRAPRPSSGRRWSDWPASRGSSSPTSARGGATPSCGTSTSSRSSPPSCPRPSPGPRTPTWPTSTTSRPSAPTRTSCPWCSRPWLASAASGRRISRGRSTRCCAFGRRCTAKPCG